MAKVIKVKYSGTCRRCGENILAGATANWVPGQGLWCYGGCASASHMQSRADREYAQGVAEGERYLSNKAIYGQELADQWEMEEELARYNRGDDY